MPVSGNDAERARAHYRWGERYTRMGDKRRATAHFGRAAWYNSKSKGRGSAFGGVCMSEEDWTEQADKEAKRAKEYLDAIAADPSAYNESGEWFLNDYEREASDDEDYFEDRLTGRECITNDEDEDLVSAFETEAMRLGVIDSEQIEKIKKNKQYKPHMERGLGLVHGGGTYVLYLFDLIAGKLKKRGESQQIGMWREKKRAFRKDYKVPARSYAQLVSEDAAQEEKEKQVAGKRKARELQTRAIKKAEMEARDRVAKESSLKRMQKAARRRVDADDSAVDPRSEEEIERAIEELHQNMANARRNLGLPDGAREPSGSGSGSSGSGSSNKRRKPVAQHGPIDLTLTSDSDEEQVDLTGDD